MATAGVLLHPLADQYPLHFRKIYYPGRLHGEPEVELNNQQRASELIKVPPPIVISPVARRRAFSEVMNRQLSSIVHELNYGSPKRRAAS